MRRQKSETRGSSSKRGEKGDRRDVCMGWGEGWKMRASKRIVSILQLKEGGRLRDNVKIKWEGNGDIKESANGLDVCLGGIKS